MRIGRRAWKVWFRDLIVWSKYWFASLIGTLGEPILYFLAIGYGLGSFIPAIEGVSYLEFLAPALVLSSVMNSASFETTFSSFTRMAKQKTYDSIAVTPVNMAEVVAGEILWGATKACMTGGVMFATIKVLGLTSSPWSWGILPVMAITAMLFSSLGMLMTAFAPDYDFFTYYFTLFLEPMFLFSGTFFPLSTLPKLVQKLAWFLPLTPPVHLCRQLALGHVQPTLLLHLLWTGALALIFFFFAVNRMVKRLVV